MAATAPRSAPPRRRPSAAKADAKVAASAVKTGGRSTLGAVGREAGHRAKTGGGLNPKNIIPKRPSKIGQSGGGKAKRPAALLSKTNPRRALVAEFLVCFLVLGGASVVAPSGSKSGIPRLMSKGTALALLFLVLALFSAAGEKSAKFAAGLGALVTAGYLFTSPDAVNILHWMQQFYGPGGGQLASAAGAGGDTGATAIGPGGEVGSTIAGLVAGLTGDTLPTGAGGDVGSIIGGVAQSAGTTSSAPANPGGANKQGLT